MLPLLPDRELKLHSNYKPRVTSAVGGLHGVALVGGDLSTDLYSGSAPGLLRPKLLLEIAVVIRRRMSPDLNALCPTVFE